MTDVATAVRQDRQWARLMTLAMIGAIPGDGVHREWLQQRRRALGAVGRLRIDANPYHHYLIAAERWDNTFPSASVISVGKARTSALFRKPTKLFEDAINKGRIAMTALPDTLLTPLQGGIPITVRGQVVGAVGVSGASSAQQDEDLATAGIKALMESMGDK